MSTIFLRQRYLSPIYRTFDAFKKPFVIEKGDKQYVWDLHGNKYLDVHSQNVCISVGHAHKEVIKMASEQLERLPHCSSAYYSSKSGLLAKKLVDLVPPHPSGEDWVVHLVNSGSDAVDLALQMAREYTKNTDIIGMYRGYHGLQGLAAPLTAIGKSTQKSHAGMYPGIRHVFPNKIEELDNYLTLGTSGNVAGIIIEPIQGYGGIFEINKDYMSEAFKMVREKGGVTIADEVQTGLGRCGDGFWGFEGDHKTNTKTNQDDNNKDNSCIPDIITIAKGLGNGVGIIGAVICKRSIAEAFTNKMFFNTYSGNPVACAAACGVLNVIQDENLQTNCLNMGNLFNKKAKKLCEKFPHIYKEVRGRGLFQAVEIYGENYEESILKTEKLHDKILSHGLVMSMGSGVGNVLRFQPPMCVNEDDINKIISVLINIADD
jgi:alanine-glyoxylate transaminase / (R)-3-amino-2-methylpropionate-pyruvate transaminase